MEAYSIEDKGEGIEFCVYCFNVQPGIVIDYLTGDSHVAEFRERYMSITHVLNQIYEPIENMNVKKISVTKVTAALKEEGYLLEEPNSETGKVRKVPSKKGMELGIYVSEREYNGRIYQSVIYNQNAQEYVVTLIRKLAE